MFSSWSLATLIAKAHTQHVIFGIHLANLGHEGLRIFGLSGLAQQPAHSVQGTLAKMKTLPGTFFDAATTMLGIPGMPIGRMATAQGNWVDS